MKRGDILYEQGEDTADCQFWIICGSATIIRSYIDHDLLYKIRNEKRVNKAKLDETLLTYSSQNSEQHICAAHDHHDEQSKPSPQKVSLFEGHQKDLLSNTENTDDDKIIELSEHSTDSLSNSASSDNSGSKVMRNLDLKQKALK